MIILGIETSCDETAAAVLQRKNGCIHILSNVISSSAVLQEKYGGVLPEQAAREQVKMIIPVIEEALNQAFPNHKPYTINHIPPIDAIAITYGPGLIGSLLVGVETAKTLAKAWGKPLIPVNHLLGHFYANWVDPQIPNTKYEIPSFPCIGLLVSGGHTDLLYFKSHHEYEYLGGTRDDAAGECFDKCARLLGFSYPGGPQIARLASQGDALRFKLPRPMIESKNFDFSFSGLKTAFANIVHTSEESLRATIRGDLAASLEAAIVDVLVTKTIQAVKKYGVKQVIVAGGVAANQKLRSDLKNAIYQILNTIYLSIPPANLCTDNAAMIASRAFFESPIDPLLLQANPSLQYT